MSCNMNCENCYYKAINPPSDEGFCYMFRNEPDGDCGQFKFSDEAKKSMQKSLDNMYAN